ncbi:MAG: RHS repeat-associated core domain-containing protein, partial [Pseudomonadota bacterium]
EHAPEVLNPDWAGHLTDVAAALPQTPTRHRFTGKYLDDDTGLYYFGARYYDPALGRFVTPDPLYLSDPQRCTDNQLSCALFVYAANNPMAYVDPTGLETVIAPDAAYREDMEQNYQRFDPTARVDRETGVLSQSWLHGAWLDIQHFFDPSVNNFAKGRELVRQAIDNPELTVVVNTPGLTRTVPLDPARDITADPGTTIIHFDPTAPRSSAEFDPVGNTSVVRPADMGVVLAHETIHSLRLMSGTDLGDVVVTLPGLDGTMHSHIRAEWRTVGVGGLNLPGDITENDIRRMMGIPERNHAD